MRGYTTYLLAGTAAAALLAAPAPAAADDPVTVTYVLYETINNIGDPVMNVNFSEHMITKALFEPLVWDFDARTQDSSLRPTLATDWELIDDHTWRWHLREGVTFHNGNPFDAHAVKFTIERVQEEGFPSGDKFLDVPISHVEIVDDYTVDIVTTEPVPILPNNLVRNGGFILDPEHYADLPLEEARWNPVGTGPYKIVEYRPDDRLILERHEDYWGWPDEANVDRLVFRFIPEMSTAVSELLDGTVDIVRLSADLAQVVDEADGAHVIIAPSLTRAMLGLNMDMYPELQDPRVRQALNIAIDREAMVDALAFGNRDLISITAVNPPNENPDLEPYPYDPDRARELLAAAGYPDGFSIDTIDVMMPEAFDHAEIVASFWDMIGVEVAEVRLLDWAVVRERWAQRTLSVHSFSWSASENTPVTDLWSVSDRRQTNSTHWLHDEFEELYGKLMTTMDADERQAMNYRMQEILYEDPPWIYLYLQPLVMGVNDRIGGYFPHPSFLVEDWASIYVKEDHLH
jgi:peptide/nickel transport system substrate-binding protein